MAGPAQPFVRTVHLRQKGDIGRRILGSEALPAIRLRLHFSGLSVRPNQPRNLRHAQSGDLAQIRSDRASLLLPLLMILLLDKHLFDPVVNLSTVLPAELDLRAGLQELVDL